MKSWLVFLVCLGVVCAPLRAQFGAAVVTLGQTVGPRQHGMGGAGVAVPDAGQGLNHNPALAGLSFPRDKRTLTASNAWLNIGDGPEWGIRDTDAPLLFEGGPFETAFTGYPGWYQPGLGYAGLDRQALKVEWYPELRESFYSLTLATAPDFLQPRGFQASSGWDWTLGVTIKLYESTLAESSPGQEEARGVAVDFGGAWLFHRIPLLPGMEVVAGAALLNLGAPVFYSDAGSADPMPEQWRIGWSLGWKPFPRRRAQGTWNPLSVLVTQDLRREFHGRKADGDPRFFPGSLLHDFFRRPGKAWRERITQMGAEVTVLEVASLRTGRYREGYYRGNGDGGAAYAWGYGISTGSWLGPFSLQYDFARFFRTVSVRTYTPGTLHQKSLQARFSW